MTFNLKKSLVAGLLVAAATLVVAGQTVAADEATSEASVSLRNILQPGGPNPYGPATPNDLRIIQTSHFRFGTIDLNNIDVNEPVTVFANSINENDADGKHGMRLKNIANGGGADNLQETVPFVRIHDTRVLTRDRANDNTPANGWKVHLKLADVLKKGATALRGAQIFVALTHKSNRTAGDNTANIEAVGGNILGCGALDGENMVEINTEGRVVLHAKGNDSKNNVEGFFGVLNEHKTNGVKLVLPYDAQNMAEDGEFKCNMNWTLTAGYEAE